MAKKKASEIGSSVGYGPVPVAQDARPMVPDNNPASGLSQLPDYNLCGYDYYRGPGKIGFPNNIGKGEADGADDVVVNTANGISNSRNKGRGVQYNWGPGLSGKWNQNDDWTGGNISGL